MTTIALYNEAGCELDSIRVKNNTIDAIQKATIKLIERRFSLNPGDCIKIK